MMAAASSPPVAVVSSPPAALVAASSFSVTAGLAAAAGYSAGLAAAASADLLVDCRPPVRQPLAARAGHSLLARALPGAAELTVQVVSETAVRMSPAERPPQARPVSASGLRCARPKAVMLDRSLARQGRGRVVLPFRVRPAPARSLSDPPDP
jgi:hypothetical protein